MDEEHKDVLEQYTKALLESFKQIAQDVRKKQGEMLMREFKNANTNQEQEDAKS